MREYTRLQTIIANIPYAVMIPLGAAAIAGGFGFSPWAVAGGAAYLAYGIAGSLWIMVFVCPYCGYYATRSCPCGYGMPSARLAKKGVINGQDDCFPAKFKRHIPVIVPLWILPVLCGGLALWSAPSWWLGGLLAAFVLDSYVILPLVSRRHACSECPQKDDCPWMAGGTQAA